MTDPETADFLSEPLGAVVTLGVDMFAEALEDQGVNVVRVDWRPPAESALEAYRLLGALED